MRTVWKYPLPRRQHAGYAALEIGDDAIIVLTGLDPVSKTPTIWVEHERPKPPRYQDANAPARLPDVAKVRYFRVAMTGDDIEPDEKHIGSIIETPHVWHIYERATGL